MQGYLPAIGSIGPLAGDLVDPSGDPSGNFGGDVLSLRLNIDFSDAGATPGVGAVRFGDLVLANFAPVPQVNGLTVRQLSGVANTLLGGGGLAQDIDVLDPLIRNINTAFRAGAVSQFALDHLRLPGGVTPPVGPPQIVPLPAALWGGMALVGGLGASQRLRRRTC